jgi:hypothetical protein
MLCPKVREVGSDGHIYMHARGGSVAMICRVNLSLYDSWVVVVVAIDRI